MADGPLGPIGQISRHDRRRAILALAAAELAQLGPLLVLERRMKRTGGPGIIPFELAGSAEETQRILEAWGSEGQAAARLSLILDFPFPATYAPLHALACTAAADAFARRERAVLARAGPALAWAQLAAALFDYVENGALLLILSGREGSLPVLARRASLAKFGLLFAGWGYVLMAARPHSTWSACHRSMRSPMLTVRSSGRLKYWIGLAAL